MTQTLLHDRKQERPALLLPIVSVAAAYAMVLLFCGGLSLAQRMPMSAGAQLLGSGLEVMGPAPYFLYAFALACASSGLWHAKNWARHLAIILCAAGVFLLVPHISSAVMDERYLAMCSDGLQILVRVAIASYLWRERDWFTR